MPSPHGIPGGQGYARRIAGNDLDAGTGFTVDLALKDGACACDSGDAPVNFIYPDRQPTDRGARLHCQQQLERAITRGGAGAWQGAQPRSRCAVLAAMLSLLAAYTPHLPPPGHPCTACAAVRYMRQLAEEARAPLPLADLAFNHLLTAAAIGHGRSDWGAIALAARAAAGLPVPPPGGAAAGGEGGAGGSAGKEGGPKQ